MYLTLLMVFRNVLGRKSRRLGNIEGSSRATSGSSSRIAPETIESVQEIVIIGDNQEVSGETDGGPTTQAALPTRESHQASGVERTCTRRQGSQNAAHRGKAQKNGNQVSKVL